MKLPKILKALSAPQEAAKDTDRTSVLLDDLTGSRARLAAELASLKADLHDLYERAPQSL